MNENYWNFICIIIIRPIFILPGGRFVNPPDALLTKKQIKQKLLAARIGNFDNDIGRDFGEFSALDIKGQKISKNDLVGKVTFVHFWFDACSPCHLVLEPLNALYAKYKADANFQVLSFTFDSNDTLKKNVTKYGLLYRAISVSNKLCHDLMGEYHGFSCIFIVDQKAKIVLGHSGIGSNGTNAFTDIFIPKIESLLTTVLTNTPESP